MNFTLQSSRNTQDLQQVSYLNALTGSVRNETKYPITCGITPTFVGGNAHSDRLLKPAVNGVLPKATETFEVTEARSERQLTTITAWKVECRSNLEYKFAHPQSVVNFSGGSVSAHIEKTKISFEVTNDSDSPIEILWNDSSFVNLDRKAGRIMHEGMKFSTRDQPQPNTTIPPQAKIEDVTIPTQNVHLVEGRFGGWVTSLILADRMPVEATDEWIAHVKGGKVVLFLQFLVSGKKVPVSVPFEIADVVAIVAPEK